MEQTIHPSEIRVHKGWTIGASAVGSTILSVSASMFGPQVTDHLPHFDYHAEGVNIERILDGKTTNKSVPSGKKSPKRILQHHQQIFQLLPLYGKRSEASNGTGLCFG